MSLIKCPDCNKQIGATDSFCNHCGNTIKPEDTPTGKRLRYRNKTAIRKDKIGFGFLLEVLGIVIGILTLSPLIGAIIFFSGFAVARLKRFVCVNCGNELSRESKICPTCRAQYEK